MDAGQRLVLFCDHNRVQTVALEQGKFCPQVETGHVMWVEVTVVY